MELPPKGFKVTVTQSWDVYLHYQEGFVVDADDPVEIQNEVINLVLNDALNAVYEDDGVIVKNHTDTDTSNGFIGFVEEFDADVDIEYTTNQMPARIATELEKLKKERKND